MKIDIDKISDYLSQILNNGIDLKVEDLNQFESIEEKELAYGLICLSEDLEFYKTKSESTISNLKSALFNSSMVVLTDSKGRITSVNDQYVKRTGYSEKELIGQTFSLINSNYHDESFFQDLWVTISSGTVWRGEIRNIDNYGNVYWVNTHIFPIKNQNGKITEYWSIHNDITDKKIIELKLNKTNRELKKALEAKVHLMKEMHHRIKNNLQLLSSMLKLKAKNSSPELEESINDIINQINSIASVHEMLYKKAEQKSINLIRYLKLTFNESKISISKETELNIEAENFFIRIEGCTYLGIIVNELLTNSFKYAWDENNLKGSKIDIAYKADGDFLHMTYRDNGKGFKKIDSTEGLGTTLIDLLIIHQLEGEYKIDSENGFFIEMKIPNNLLVNKNNSLETEVEIESNPA